MTERRRPVRNEQMRDAMRDALTREPSVLAHRMAERQRDERAAPRTSPGYDRFMRSKAPR